MRDQRRELAERLRERSSELEEAIFDRIRALEEAESGLRQLQGLRAVIGSSVEHGLVAVEVGERLAPDPPPAAIAHARNAAWRSVSTHILHERYTAGYSVFRRFLLSELDSPELAGEVHSSTDVVFERLIRAVGEEHERERQKRRRSSDGQRLERINELLAGRLTDAPELGYPFDGTHLAIVGRGREMESAVRQLARSIHVPGLLLVSPTSHQVWAWLGSQQKVSPPAVESLLKGSIDSSARFGIGEAASSLDGWRQTHHQAAGACAVAPRNGSRVVRYAEVAVLVSMMQDDLLKQFLREAYLDPLSVDTDSGRRLRDTIRAYLIAERNAASAAAALGVTRQTINNRLRAIEDRLDMPLSKCLAGLDAALHLQLELEAGQEVSV